MHLQQIRPACMPDSGRLGLPTVPFGYPGYVPAAGPSSVTGLGRLVALILLATLGTLGNLYTVAACVVGDRLRKKGNAFLVSVSVTMLLVTLGVLPSLAIHVLADANVSPQARRLHEHLVELCGCVSLFALCTVAVESYVRVCHRRLHGRLVGRRCVAAGLLLVWALGGATFGVLLLAREERYAEEAGPLVVGTGGTVTLLTGALYLLTWRRARHLRRCTCHGRHTRPMPWHVQLVRANAAVWLTFCVCWLPAAALRLLPPEEAAHHQWLLRLPLAHATTFNLLYSVFSEDFRESYGNLARYCWCRVSVDYGRRPASDLPRPLLQRPGPPRSQPPALTAVTGPDARVVLAASLDSGADWGRAVMV
ncbi:Melatonin receptor type 1A [Amphibalanus amphitrite]|uniref:Melatonin receptor type 1A n=1 Tax=Amphibalanus amphitrite TaxID=1232801 RepID=A0A6A4VZS1_AMPAM|nr:Melatonin receptor type 1A [Amphibalanus amphitrite]KAF0297394.1 Melatonin receptor type 1A [Amphibalanus amphitrite]